MKRLLIAALLALAACGQTTTQDTAAEQVITELYATVASNIGTTTTRLDAIPMSESLRDLVTRAEAAATARGEPFIEGDIPANCQDCTSISSVAVGAPSDPELVTVPAGHRLVEARFTLNGNEPRSVLYDMAPAPEGWRVDNILTEGFNLRTESEAYLAQEPPPEPVTP